MLTPIFVVSSFDALRGTVWVRDGVHIVESEAERSVVSSVAIPLGCKVMATSAAITGPDEHHLARWLLENASHDYVATLPSNLDHLPVFWSDEDKALLAGSDIGKCLERRLARDDAVSASRDWHRATALVRSRSFELKQGYALAPFFDMLNHDSAPNCFFVVEYDELVARAVHDVPPDSELTFSYGDLTPASSLLNYGFVVDFSERDTAWLDGRRITRSDDAEHVDVAAIDRRLRDFPCTLRDDLARAQGAPTRNQRHAGLVVASEKLVLYDHRARALARRRG